MNHKLKTEATVGIVRETDEVVIKVKVGDSESEERKYNLREFISVPENTFVHVDEDWCLHIVPQGGKAIISEPLPEELRYEE